MNQPENTIAIARLSVDEEPFDIDFSSMPLGRFLGHCYARTANPLPLLRKAFPMFEWKYVATTEGKPEAIHFARRTPAALLENN